MDFTLCTFLYIPPTCRGFQTFRGQHMRTTLTGRFIGTSVNENSFSATDTAATQCIYACRHGQVKLLKSKLRIRMMQKGDLSNFVTWLLVPDEVF